MWKELLIMQTTSYPTRTQGCRDIKTACVSVDV